MQSRLNSSYCQELVGKNPGQLTLAIPLYLHELVPIVLEPKGDWNADRAELAGLH